MELGEVGGWTTTRAQTRYGCFLPDLTGLARRPSIANLPGHYIGDPARPGNPRRVAVMAQANRRPAAWFRWCRRGRRSDFGGFFTRRGRAAPPPPNFRPPRPRRPPSYCL